MKILYDIFDKKKLQKQEDEYKKSIEINSKINIQYIEYLRNKNNNKFKYGCSYCGSLSIHFVDCPNSARIILTKEEEEGKLDYSKRFLEVIYISLDKK